jgi:hypothetical protein
VTTPDDRPYVRDGESRPPHVYEFFTHDELKLCLCVAFAAKAQESYGVYPIDQYATPGEEHESNEWTELVLRAARYLAFEHGLLYAGVHCHRDGRVTAEKPVAPGNYLYVALIKAGGFPDFDVLLPQVISWAAENAPSLPLEPLRSLLHDIEAEISAGLLAADPGVMRQIAELRREAVAVVRPTLERMFSHRHRDN